MGPAEGMRLLSKEMLVLMRHMTEAFEAGQNDTFVVHYENITRSSQDFDAVVGQMVDFLFDGLITPEEHERVLVEARKQDLNRETDGQDATSSFQAKHTNDAECESDALAVLPSLADVYADVEQLQRRLHYA